MKNKQKEWHHATKHFAQYTIDTVQSFTFLRRIMQNCKNIINSSFKNVCFALLIGWNEF
jgi:hypothetical protein